MCDFFINQVNGKEFWEQVDLLVGFFKSADPPSDYDRQALANTTIDWNKNQRQWNYQFCSQVGYFQNQDFDHYMRSKNLNESYWEGLCKELF